MHYKTTILELLTHYLIVYKFHIFMYDSLMRSGERNPGNYNIPKTPGMCREK